MGNWNLLLHFMTLAHNSQPHETTGVAPMMAFLGRNNTLGLKNFINLEFVETCDEYVQNMVRAQEIISRALDKKRIEKHDDRITNKNKKNKILYEVGQRVRLQNVATHDWDLKGTVERLRYADYGRVVSYYIMTDRNHLTTRHRRFLKPLNQEHDPKFIANKNTDTHRADLPNFKQVLRRSDRLSKAKSVKRLTMG